MVPSTLSIQFLVGFLLTVSPSNVDVREWSDASGNYQVKGELIAYNSKSVVLQNEEKELISLEITDLSDADKQYLQAIRKGETRFAPPEATKTWGMKSGLKIKGRVLEFAKRQVHFDLHDGKVYVNDVLFDNLPPVYQKMVPRIVAVLERNKVENVDDLILWLKGTPGQSKTYDIEGVLFELENGDRYGIPLFFFSDIDLKALEPAWKRWVAAEKNRELQEQESFYLRAQSQSQSSSDSDNLQRMREIAEVQLRLQAFDAGLFDLWEVGMVPLPGNYGRPMKVVVPGRNSDQAQVAALQGNPGYRVVQVAKVRRRR